MMRYLNYKTSIVGIFIASTAMLLLYLLSMRYHIPMPVGFFWVSIGLVFGSVTYQCTRVELSSGYIKVVLLEIMFACIVFHLIYQIPFHHSFGWDPYIDMVGVKGILTSGFILGDPQYINDTVYWPMIHILGSQLTLITDVDLLHIVKWFPSFLGAPLILILYLLMRDIFEQEKVALLSALLFASVQSYIVMHSIFIREAVALFLAIYCIYFYLSSVHSPYSGRNYIFRALSIICLFGTVLAHHLTSFMLVIFLFIHYIIKKASDISFLRNVYFGTNIIETKVNASFILIGLVSIFMHWRYNLISPLGEIVRHALRLLTPNEWGIGAYGVIHSIAPASLPTLRSELIFFAFVFFILIFAVILIVQVLPRNKNSRIETYSFTAFLSVCGLITLLFLWFLSVGVFPERFQTFGWLLGGGPLVLAILNYRHRWLRQAGIFLLFTFMLFNIYQIYPKIWNQNVVDMPAAVTEENYALASSIDFSTGTLAAETYSQIAIYDVHNNMGKRYLSSSDSIDVEKYDWIVINKQFVDIYAKLYHGLSTEMITKVEQLMEGKPIYRNKIYESDNLVVSKIRD